MELRIIPYAFKVESLNGAFGSGTDYELILEAAPPFEADAYDDVPGQRAFDDDTNGKDKLWTGSSANEVVHNLHDQGDIDWTIIHAEDFTVSTELVGTNIQPKISLYKWTAADYSNSLGYYTFVDDYFVDSETNSWQSPIVNFDTQAEAYAVKVESPTGQYGPNTSYKLIFGASPTGTPDAYENSTIHGDDNEGTPVRWQGLTDTIHYQNFHDNNDVDWTLVYTPSFNVYANAIGNDADIKMTVYRWDSADEVNGVFTNIVKEQVGFDWSPGDSTVNISTNQADTYLIKVESRNGAFGNNTNYSLTFF